MSCESFFICDLSDDPVDHSFLCSPVVPLFTFSVTHMGGGLRSLFGLFQKLEILFFYYF